MAHQRPSEGGQMKPGYKTTEYWLAVAAALLGLFLASGLFGDSSAIMQAAGALSAALASAGYSHSRGAAKADQLPSEAEERETP